MDARVSPEGQFSRFRRLFAGIDDVVLNKPNDILEAPKFFKKVMVSASAAMKMMRHAQHGVETGLARESNPVPIEIMGLMIGHCDPDDARTIIVTDAFPLPVEGTETSVMADDPHVNEYMSQLQDSLEKTRKDRVCGWYHSHPFEVGEHSNCFFSAQDVSSQFAWQTQFETMGAEGDPFCGIVVDPLRSLTKGKPELGAFHCYPQDFTPPRGLGPDGRTYHSAEALQERWGAGARAYYEVPIEIFQSELAQRMSGILARDFMWVRLLASTPMLDREAREALSNRLQTAADRLAEAERHAAHARGTAEMLFGAHGMVPRDDVDPDLRQATKNMADASLELCEGQTTQVVKHLLFNEGPQRGIRAPTREPDGAAEEEGGGGTGGAAEGGGAGQAGAGGE